ncbi:MAG: sodium/solute symporter [Planctomycetota bacterium]|nr:sodium/solute symporter [Planctomycetota bacterium]
MTRTPIIFFLLLLLVAPALSAQNSARKLEWDLEIPPVPDMHGFAGAFTGVSNGRLLVAGGANFPDKPPWEDGKKVWHDKIFALSLPGGGGGESGWVSAGTLPGPLAYGASVSFAERAIFIGGDNGVDASSRVFAYSWGDGLEGPVDYPSLPSPCTNLCAAVVSLSSTEAYIFVAGGLSSVESKSVSALKNFWSLSVGPDGAPVEGAEWEALGAWPGPERFQATAGVVDKGFYIIGGLRLDEGKRVMPPLSDGYRYSPATRSWAPIADLPRGVAAAPTPAPRLSDAHLLVAGGGNPDALSWAAANPDRSLGDHPGFSRECFAYHSVVDRWVSYGAMEFPDVEMETSRVTVNTVEWGGRWFIPSGEAKPGVRSPRVFAVRAVHEGGFTNLDWSILGIYLALLVWIGWWLSKRGKSTGDFFLAGGRIPWWAAGLSVFATQLSSLTFMATPAKVFRTDCTYYIQVLTIVMIAPVIVFFFLPIFRRMNITTVYEYLERRFNLAVRLFSSASFILFQLGRMTIVLYLPALALQAVTGINIYVCVSLMVVLATVYTYLGGMEAVVWTDVLQAVVLVGGALVTVFIIAGELDGGLGELVSTATAEGKLRLVEMDWGLDSYTKPVLWVILVGGIFQQFASYGSDQAVVQRYLTTPDEKSAAKAVWANALLAIPIPALLFFVGAALYVYYQQNPIALSPGLKTEQVFPLFMVQSLPAGVSGIVIAGLLAATMSTLDSSMNSVSAAFVTDFYRRFKPDRSEDHYLRVARLATLILGVLALCTGLLLALYSEQWKSMLDLYLAVLGLLLGAVAGIVCLAIFTRRANSTGALVGAAAACFALWLANGRVHPLLYAAIGIVTCFCVGYLASMVVGGGESGETGESEVA